MNAEKEIEQYLSAAPKPPAPNGLLDKLQADVLAGCTRARRSALRRWFAPTGERISLRRVVAAAAIAIAVLLPLSFGATKIVRKYFVTFEAEFEYPEDNTVYKTTQTTVTSGDNIESVEDAKRVLEEFGKLYREGKAEEIRPGIWMVTLSDGEKFAYGGDPDALGLSDDERTELLKRQFDEIQELKKAGKLEKTYKPEHDFVVDGVKYRYFEARYVLSDGTVKTIGSSEPVIEEDRR
ncbi:MAG: hypothetical protein ACYS8Z_03365 [Planctomycetota bacterium]|jgi:hypothetical protein